MLNSIIILRNKHDSSNNINFIRFKDIKIPEERIKDELNFASERDEISLYTIKGKILQKSLEDDRWLLNPKIYNIIFKSAFNNTTPLGQLCLIGVGIQTGRDNIFVINKEKINKYKIEKQVLRRFLKNGDLRRYRIEFNDLYLIYSTKDIDLSKYPNLQKYLSKHKNELKRRHEFKQKKCKWYELSVIRNKEIFDSDKPKIISPFMSTENRFVVDNDNIYTGSNDIYVIQPLVTSLSVKSLTVLLNSKFLEFFHKNYAKLKRDNYYEYYTKTLEKYPIKIPQNQQPFIILCNYMLFLNKTEARRKSEKELIEFIDKQIIDPLVYELYFKEKFKQDGIKTNLFELVEPYFKDISNLNSDEQKLQTIKKVVEKIKNDKRVMGQMEKIKSHPWVRVIEGRRK
mgnify:CR=1 FL=1